MHKVVDASFGLFASLADSEETLFPSGLGLARLFVALADGDVVALLVGEGVDASVADETAGGAVLTEGEAFVAGALESSVHVAADVGATAVVEGTLVDINTSKTVFSEHVSGVAGAEVFSVNDVGAELCAGVSTMAAVDNACKSIASQDKSFWARADEGTVGVSACVGASTVVGVTFVDISTVGIINSNVSWEAFTEESGHAVCAHLLAVVELIAHAFVHITIHVTDLFSDRVDFTVQEVHAVKKEDIILSGGNASEFLNIS